MKAENYDFAFTDTLMRALEAANVEPFYRLGVTIENYPDIARYHIEPPKDYGKWARICEHVIRHYTEGWANGFRMKVTYWEIWNECDIHFDPEKNEMWHADYAAYVDLYEVASKHLKKCFPHLKIGGPACCGFNAVTRTETDYVAEKGPAVGREKWRQAVHQESCARAFLAAVRDRKCPMDFFSFHSYASVPMLSQQIAYAKKLLETYGLDHAELWLDEWLPRPRHDKLGTAEQSSEIAAALLSMQNSALCGACLYDARCGTGAYSPLFNPLTYKPHRAYYAFTAFNELKRCGTAVAVTTDGAKGLFAAAAKGARGAAVMIANESDVDLPLTCDFQGRKVITVRMTDASRADTVVTMPTVLSAYSFVIVLLELNES